MPASSVSQPLRDGRIGLLLSLLCFLPFALVVLLAKQGVGFVGIVSAGILPALVALAGLVLGLRALPRSQGGAATGFALGSICVGGLGLLFWLLLAPLMAYFALPALRLDTGNPQVEESTRNIRVLLRHVKTFQRDHGRLPVKLEELVEKGYAPARVLYDPRDPMRDVPGYRLMLRRLPPEAEWTHTPLIEGRWPERNGNRLFGYADEAVRSLPTAPAQPAD